MSYENIRINDPVFCVGPQIGGYYTLAPTETSCVVYVKNNEGTIVDTYSLSPLDGLDYEVSGAIKDFIYIGPINQSSPADGLTFYTLESIEYVNCESCGEPLRVELIRDHLLSHCPVCGNYSPSVLYSNYKLFYFKSYIKKWLMDVNSKTLILYSTIEKISDTEYNYEASSLVIETLETTLSTAIEPSKEYVNLTTTSGIEKYDEVMIGPSNHSYSYNKIEYANVHSVDEYKIEITTIEGYLPTKNYYMADDGVVIIKGMYLICKCKYVPEEIGTNEFIFHRFDEGFLYKLDYKNYGSMLEVNKSNIYNYSGPSVWDLSYKTIDVVHSTQLLFIDPHYNYMCIKSMQLFNHYENDILTIYDMDIVGTTLYMLQRKITKRDDYGDTFLFSWATYNYAVESLLPSTNSISIIVDDYNLTQNQVVNIRAIVKDQFAATLVNKDVEFYKEKALGLFEPVDGTGVTDGNGIVDLTFHLISPTVNEELEIKVRVTGGGTHLGSGYVWDSIVLYIEYDATNTNMTLLAPYYYEGCDIEYWWPQYATGTIYTVKDEIEVYGTIYTRKVHQYLHYFFKYLLYHHPLGNSVAAPPPPKPAPNFAVGGLNLTQGKSSGDLYLESPTGGWYPLDILYVSRHFNSNINSLSLDIYQFQFLTEAHPTFFSEKNTINTYIWLRLRPYAFDLVSNTLVFKMRETSYRGDTGWVDVTSELTITYFDAGGGLYGLDVLWPNNYVFHNGGTVYISIEVYDAASPPNRIGLEYWFKIVPDYFRPYITNEFPARAENNVSLDTLISFDIIDVGSGVDTNSIEVYVKSREVRNLNITRIEGTEGNVHVEFKSELVFLYSDVIDISVYASDVVGNQVVEKWMFYCLESTPPWYNEENVEPRNCSKGLYKFYDEINLILDKQLSILQQQLQIN